MVPVMQVKGRTFCKKRIINISRGVLTVTSFKLGIVSSALCDVKSYLLGVYNY